MVAVAATCVFLAFRVAPDPDLWGHTLYGLRHLDRGGSPEPTDPFSYSAAAAEWINHEWLAELVMGALFGSLGGAGLVLYQAGISLLLMGWLMWNVWAKLAGSIIPVLLSCAVLGGLHLGVSPRPQLWTLVGLAAFLALARTDSARVLWVVPLSALWANLHGGVLAGLMLFSLWGSVDLLTSRGRRGRWRGVAAVLAWPATLATPYGVDLWRFFVRSLGEEWSIAEWVPLGVQLELMAVAGIVAIAVFAIIRAKSRPSLAESLVMLAALAAAVRHVRHVPLLAVAAGTLLPYWLARVPTPEITEGSKPKTKPPRETQIAQASAVNFMDGPGGRGRVD